MFVYSLFVPRGGCVAAAWPPRTTVVGRAARRPPRSRHVVIRVDYIHIIL